MAKPRFRPIEVTARGVGRLGERDRVPIRVGDVHVADAVRVGLDRFVLDAGGSEALEERVEPGDGEGEVTPPAQSPGGPFGG
jgi:hypothetical protein